MSSNVKILPGQGERYELQRRFDSHHPCKWPCGGIGRRARLKSEFRKECEFESHQGYYLFHMEYKRLKYELKSEYEVDDILNNEGKDGWDVVYYNETKPPKFGDPFKLIVVYKKDIRQLPSG